MAERTTESWRSTPHFYLRRSVDASRLRSWVGAIRLKAEGSHVSITDLLIKLVAESLRHHPRVNAAWRDNAPVPSAAINIAIAVATDEGLVTPVVHRADTLDVASIAARRDALVLAARAGRLRLEDISEGTFTISNLGTHGIDSFDAVINPPQVAILAVGRIAERVVPIDGLPEVRPMIELGMS